MRVVSLVPSLTDTVAAMGLGDRLVGVTDWSNSEIMAGIQDGEVVALLGGVSQEAQQSQMGGRAGMMFRF